MTDNKEVKGKSESAGAPIAEESFAHQALIKFKKIALYLVIAVAIALTVAYISENKDAEKIASWNEILKATFTAQTTFGDVAEEVSKANAKIPGTPASQYGDMLVMSAAGITYEKDKLELAKNAALDFIKTNNENPFTTQVRLDLGTIYFNLEEYDAALKEYDEVINSESEILKYEAMMYKALTLEKTGKDNEAISTYNDVIDEINKKKLTSLSNFTDYAEFARTQLLDKKAKN